MVSADRSAADAFRQANAIGRSSKTVREFLEKNHKDDMSREESIKLAIKSLLEVVQTGAKNIEITVMERYGEVTVSSRFVYPRSMVLINSQNLTLSEIETIVSDIEKEKEAGAHVPCTKSPFETTDHSTQRRSGSARGWQRPLQARQQ
jgi:hypothetical protein